MWRHPQARRALGTVGLLKQTSVFPGPPHISELLKETHRLMELLRRDPDFLLSVVQMSRSLNRKRERSFFPPTVFYRTEKNGELGHHLWERNKNFFFNNKIFGRTASTTISCLRNFLCGFRIWQEMTSLGIAWGQTGLYSTTWNVLSVLYVRKTFGLLFVIFPNYKINFLSIHH